MDLFGGLPAVLKPGRGVTPADVVEPDRVVVMGVTLTLQQLESELNAVHRLAMAERGRGAVWGHWAVAVTDQAWPFLRMRTRVEAIRGEIGQAFGARPSNRSSRSA